MALAAARLLQLDPIQGSTQLWATRPIPRTTLLAAKLTVLLGVLVLPCALLEAFRVCVVGLQIDAAGWIAIVAGTLALRGALILVLALVAVLTRHLASWFFASAALLVGLAVWEGAGRSLGLWSFPALDARGAALELTRRLLAAVIVLLGAGAGLYATYRTRRLLPAIVGLAALLVAQDAVRHHWPVTWPGTGDAVLAASPSAPVAWSHATVEVLPNEPFNWSASDGSLHLRAEPHGLPSGLSLVQTGYSVAAEPAGHGVVRVDVDLRRPPTPTEPVRGPHQLPSFLTVALGCRVSDCASSVEVFRMTPPVPELRNLTGVLRFAVVRPRVVARGPVRVGQRFELAWQRLTVEHVPEERGRILLLAHELITPPFATRTKEPTLVSYDAAESGCYSPGSTGAGFASFGAYSRASLRLEDWHGPRRPTDSDNHGELPPPPNGWLRSTELVVLASEPLGVLEAPFRIERFPAYGDSFRPRSATVPAAMPPPAEQDR